MSSQPPIASPRAVFVGRVIDLVGQAMLPAGLGALLGFYAADQGLRLLPTMLEATLAWTLLALALIAAGRLLRGRLVRATPEGVKLRKRVVAVLVLMALALGARLGVHYAQQPSPLTQIEAADFDVAFAQDAESYRVQTQGMERLLAELERQGVPAAGKERVLSADEERLLLDSWKALLDYAVALDAIRVFWEDWYRFDPSRVQRSYHLRSYLLTYAAELSLYEKAARFCKPVLENPNAKKFLDNPHPEQGLPANSFSHFRQEFLGSRDQARVLAGQQYLGVLEKLFRGRSEAAALGTGWLWKACEQHLGVIGAVAPIDRAELTVRADSQVLKRSLRRVWFPVQKETAEMMGDIRVRRIGWYLIPHEQQEQADALLQPGDIMISRKNWYMSNVGLPGFWPHAILYLGDTQKLAAYFDEDPGVRAWLIEETGQEQSFSQYLERRFPTAWLRYRLGVDGDPARVIEAVGEGVLLNSLNHVAGDYLSAMRPRLDKRAKAQAIAEAFSHWGKPYDFDFDFATDHAVVCTELVWRAYRPEEGKQGLDLALHRVAGRMTLPANLIVGLYAEQSASEERLLDFVFFIDANEHERRTFFSDETAFKASWRRTKWDFAQQ